MSLTAPYDGYTVDKLKAELEERGLPTDGYKPDLVSRLQDDDAESTVDVGDEAEVVRAEDLPEEALTGALRRNMEHDKRREAERLAVEQAQEE